MDGDDKPVETLTLGELRELLQGTARVLVAGIKEALVETAQVAAANDVRHAPEVRPTEKPEPRSKLIGIKEVAQLLSAGERTVWKLSSCGVLPPAIKIGRSSRWRRQDIEAWIGQKAEKAEKERQKLAKRPE